MCGCSLSMILVIRGLLLRSRFLILIGGLCRLLARLSLLIGSLRRLVIGRASGRLMRFLKWMLMTCVLVTRIRWSLLLGIILRWAGCVLIIMFGRLGRRLNLVLCCRVSRLGRRWVLILLCRLSGRVIVICLVWREGRMMCRLCRLVVVIRCRMVMCIVLSRRLCGRRSRGGSSSVWMVLLVSESVVALSVC